MGLRFFVLLRHSLIYLIGRVLPGALGLATIALLTRVLAPHDYGLYALIWAAVGLFNGVFFTWNSQAIYRAYPAAEIEDRNDLLNAGLAGYGLSLIAAMVVAVIIFFIGGTGISPIFFTAAIALLAGFTWIELTSFLLNLEGRALTYAALQTARSLAMLIVGGGVAAATGSPALMVTAIAAAWAVVSLIDPFNRWWRSLRRIRLPRARIGALFRYGLPLSLSIALIQMVATTDRLLLAALAGKVEVARYAVGFDLVQFMIGAMASAVSLSFYPRIIRTLEREGEDAARALMDRYTVVLMGILFPVAAGFALTAPAIGTLLVGEQLRAGAISVMPWICLAALLANMKAFYADFSFQLGRWTVGGPITAFLTLGVSITLNLLLIPRIGIVGAAIASVVTYSAAFSVALILGRLRGFRLAGVNRDHLKIVASVLLMAIVVWQVRGGTTIAALMLQVTVGVVTYGIALFALDPMGLRRALIAHIR